jgi:hypothetical protein
MLPYSRTSPAFGDGNFVAFLVDIQPDTLMMLFHGLAFWWFGSVELRFSNHLGSTPKAFGAIREHNGGNLFAFRGATRLHSPSRSHYV